MVLFIVYLLCSTAGVVLIRLGAINNSFLFQNNVLNLKLSIFTLMGLCCYVVSFILLIILLQKFNLSYIQPLISGISYILIILASFFILKESISGLQLAGIIVVLIGVILMNIKK